MQRRSCRQHAVQAEVGPVGIGQPLLHAPAMPLLPLQLQLRQLRRVALPLLRPLRRALCAGQRLKARHRSRSAEPARAPAVRAGDGGAGGRQVVREAGGQALLHVGRPLVLQAGAHAVAAKDMPAHQPHGPEQRAQADGARDLGRVPAAAAAALAREAALVEEHQRAQLIQQRGGEKSAQARVVPAWLHEEARAPGAAGGRSVRRLDGADAVLAGQGECQAGARRREDGLGRLPDDMPQRPRPLAARAD
mmetsp:Transcript_20325/g.51175  ORF Transcript_20325/g.51175 Transcript_20325/m.51175 type:complete len:249 (+) Transcript_20325:254-1000(+)